MKLQKNKPMFLFYFSIALTILSSALYHFSAKSAPSEIDFPISLIVTYAIALVVTISTALLFPAEAGFAAELKKLNWSSFLLAIAIVGIEFGFLLAYKSGWSIGFAAVLTNVVASLLLVPVALFIFKDKLNWVNVAGILVCLIGLVMLNWRK